MKISAKQIIKWLLIAGVVAILVAQIESGKAGKEERDAKTKEEQRLADYNKQLEEKRIKSWHISTSTDEMTDKEIVVASLRSVNTVDFDFPYEGGSFLTMSVRKWNGDIDVYFKISKGQFVCSEYKGTDIVSIRFDDEDAVQYKVVEPSTGNSDILFIKSSSSEKAILSKCKKAHTIKVQTNFYSEGSRVFVFEPNEPLTDFD